MACIGYPVSSDVPGQLLSREPFLFLPTVRARGIDMMSRTIKNGELILRMKPATDRDRERIKPLFDYMVENRESTGKIYNKDLLFPNLCDVLAYLVRNKWASRLWLRDVAQWRIFDNQSLQSVLSMVLNIESIGYNGRNKDPRAEAIKDDLRPAYLVDKSREIDGNAVPFDKRRKNYEDRQYNWMWAAPEEIRAEVEYINSGIPEALRPPMSYARIFGTSVDRGGRLWGSFQYLKKNLRQVIYAKFDLEELDFDGFNLNLFFLLETGSKYRGNVYTDIMARMGIIDECEQRAYRDVIKQLVLTIFGVESREEARIIVEIGKKMVAGGLLPLLNHDALVVPQEYAQNYDVLKEEILLRQIGREKTQKSRDEEIERSQIA